MALKLDTPDERMLSLMQYAIDKGKAANERQYLLEINFPPTNISNIRRGHQSFTRDHILGACRFTGANANWIYGFESNMMRKPGKTSIEQLKEAVIAVESEIKAKNKGRVLAGSDKS